MKYWYWIPRSLLAPLLALSGLACGQESPALFLKTHIPLPNVNGRIDHLAVDVKGQRLFLAAVDNHTLEVIDLKSGQRVHTITDLAEPQGVFFDASTNRLFVACAADGVVIDAHPESYRLEESGNRIFVNVPDKKEIEVIDRVKLAVLARWPVTSAEGNFPMALDEAHHRLFVATWTPSRMLVFDTESGKEIAAGETAGPSDDLFYDSRRGRVYVLTAAGFLEVFQDRDHDHYDRIARYPTPPHTQTGLFVPEWGELFAAAQRQGELSAEIRVYEAN